MIENEAYFRTRAKAIQRTDRAVQRNALEGLIARWEVGARLDTLYGAPGRPYAEGERLDRPGKFRQKSGTTIRGGRIPAEDMLEYARIFAPHRSVTKTGTNVSGSAGQELNFYRRLSRAVPMDGLGDLLAQHHSWSGIVKHFLMAVSPERTYTTVTSSLRVPEVLVVTVRTAFNMSQDEAIEAVRVALTQDSLAYAVIGDVRRRTGRRVLDPTWA